MMLRLLVVLTLVLPPAAALADKAKARASFIQGQTLYRQGKFQQALEAFREAARHTRHPSITVNMAQCHRNLNQPKKALFFYKLYLSQWKRQYPDKPVTYEAEVKVHIRKLSERIQREQARRLATSPTGHIRVLGVMVGRAQILVDDAPRGVTPLARPIKVTAGKHVVRVEAEGFHPWRGKVTVKAGAEVPVQVELKPITVRRRSTGWLVATLGTLALAAGAEAVAIAYTLEANDYFEHTEPYHDTRDMAVAMHAVAGTLAAGGIAFLALYLTSGREVPVTTTSAAVVPLPGGAAVCLGVRF